jgi:hypothetical protein
MRNYYLEVFNIYFLKNYNLRYFVVGNVARKSRVFSWKNYRGGVINIRFRPKYRPLHSGLPTGPMRRRSWRHGLSSASPTRQVGFGYLLCCTGTYIVTVRVVDPDSDPNPAFQVNPDPGFLMTKN